MRPRNLCLLSCAVSVLLLGSVALAFNFFQPIIPQLTATPTVSASTVPSNGDTNPYGVVFVPKGFPSDGLLKPGNILVSNFNNSAAAQGTGTTIVQIDPAAPEAVAPVFFEGPQTSPGTSPTIPPATPGLTLALGILDQRYVLVGNVPSLDGSGICTPTTVGQGSLQFLDKNANVVKTLTDAEFLDGPWGLTINQVGNFAQLFVANVLSGTVTRIDLLIREWDTHDPIIVLKKTQIASGYTSGCAGASFVAGPSGLAFDWVKGILYVSSTQDNAIYAVKNAGFALKDNGPGKIVVNDSTHLHGPIGLLLAPNGDLISAQGDGENVNPSLPSEIVEFTPKGEFVDQISIDPAVGGAFGIALSVSRKGFIFAAVDDNTNMLEIWEISK